MSLLFNNGQSILGNYNYIYKGLPSNSSQNILSVITSYIISPYIYVRIRTYTITYFLVIK